MTLEPEYAEKLAVLAERAHARKERSERSLTLGTRSIEADIEARSIVEIRRRAIARVQRAELGIEEIRAGKGILLEDLWRRSVE